MPKLMFLAALNLVRNPGRALALIFCISGSLFLFIAGAAISAGISRDAALSVESGADIYVTFDRGGLDASIPVTYVKEFYQSKFVVEVRPRIVARLAVAPETWALILGIDPISEEEGLGLESGQLFEPNSKNEVVLGPVLAKRLGLTPGRNLVLATPFTNKVFKVAGILSRKGTLWDSSVIWAPFALAQEVLGMQDLATDILVRTRDEVSATRFADHLVRTEPRLRVQTKDLVRRYVQQGYGFTGGVFSAVYSVVLGSAILATLVISGFGSRERRREVALLKVLGWSTTHILILVSLEALLCCLLASALSFLSAFVWIRYLNAPLLGNLFIAELEWFPGVEIPSHFDAGVLAVGFGVSLVITWTGILFSAWRTACVPATASLQ
ncbi:MAG: FtsX-like permease family protein [Acidobacteria bacterium]|nr:FtsX-like permease family protein [Acidobacteriota bacterium]